MAVQPQLALPITESEVGEIRVYEFTLPFVPPSKNAYDGWPAQWQHSAKKKWVKALLEEFEQVDLPKRVPSVGLAAVVVFATNNRRDTQNYAQCVWHWVPDALVKYGCIADDSPGFVEIGPNWGLKMAVDTRKNLPKKRRERTHLSVSMRVV